MSIVPTLARLARGIDAFSEAVGRAVAWLAVLLVLDTCAVVLLRYGVGQGSIALQEGMTYLHATLFMLAMAVTLKRGGHVRVDIFYRRFSPRARALVDACGTAFLLLPLCALILATSWPYVAASWAIREASTEAGGLPYVWLLKGLLIAMPALLALQGVAELLKNLLFLAGEGGSPSAEKMELL